MKRAFTLAEVMITLTIIGVISAIVVPVAVNSRPNENVMKFKKAHNTLYQVINTLVTSDKYYLDGDLGVKADESQIYGGFDHFGYLDENYYGEYPDNIQYFCKTFADILSTKSVNCSMTKTAEDDSTYTFVYITEKTPYANWVVTPEVGKQRFDVACKDMAETIGSEIVTTDGITYYQTNPQATFGIIWIDRPSTYLDRLFKCSVGEERADGIDRHYKPFCIDIDGIGQGEDPFGYGIRWDGKILTGRRADEWLAKDIQGEN